MLLIEAYQFVGKSILFDDLLLGGFTIVVRDDAVDRS